MLDATPHTGFTVKTRGASVKLVLAVAASAAFVALSGCRSKGASASEPVRVAGATVELGSAPPRPVPSASAAKPRVKSIPKGETVTRFAVIGDFGCECEGEAKVAELVRAEKPDFIITTGDNNYPNGEAETIDPSIGRFYHDFIHPYVGRFGPGASENRFFPSLGNHDWRSDGAKPYLDYFTLPGNERYYDFVKGDVHFFSVDSDEHEPDGNVVGSKQAKWLEAAARASKSAWQIAYMHHPPYSSGSHGSSVELRWPYAAMGIDLVLAGHDHHYERLNEEGITYVVNGLGGNRTYFIKQPIPGSVIGYQEKHGAQFIEASKSTLVSRFVTADRQLIDEFSIEVPKKSEK